MKTKKFSESQIAFVLKQAAGSGAAIIDIFAVLF
ncbi:hypothetical protein BN961_03221 [Afipia felis]|uniref:Uncharacterized protein n=2 Tax=Afipia TaxID=1033 RepID=A0A090MV66_AFIFE|nr:hypothetical protein BN961_03221 [Afipia felis]